jgi:hypothetical protein
MKANKWFPRAVPLFQSQRSGLISQGEASVTNGLPSTPKSMGCTDATWRRIRIPGWPDRSACQIFDYQEGSRYRTTGKCRNVCNEGVLQYLGK